MKTKLSQPYQQADRTFDTLRIVRTADCGRRLAGGLFIVALLATGCGSVNSSVPHTSLTGTIGKSPFSLTFPKDMSAESIKVEVSTNGSVSVIVLNIVTKNNPDVISMSGEAYAKMRAADAAFVKEAGTAGGTVAGAIAK